MFDLPPAGILHLPGPQFLAFYGIVAVIVQVAAFLLMSFADTTGTNNLPSVPASPDPIEVAYLSGGVNAVLRTVVYDLRRLGLLTLDDDNRLAAIGAAPRELTRMRRRVLDKVLDRPKIGSLFKDKALRSSLEATLDPMRGRLAANDLLQPDSVKRTRIWTLGLGLLILFGIRRRQDRNRLVAWEHENPVSDFSGDIQLDLPLLARLLLFQTRGEPARPRLPRSNSARLFEPHAIGAYRFHPRAERRRAPWLSTARCCWSPCMVSTP